MSANDLQLWIGLYAAMGLCCALAAGLSAVRVVWLYHKDRSLWPRGLTGWLLVAPRLWWRWQKVYLTTAPVTLGIIALYAATLPWSQSRAAAPTPAAPVAAPTTSSTSS